MPEAFVDLSAAVNGTGTYASPYNDFAAFVSSITPDTAIHVKRGTSKVLTVGTRLNVTITGLLPGQDVLVDTYGEGVPPVLSGGGTNYNPIFVKRVEGGGQLVIRDLDVTNAPQAGLAIESQSGVTITNVLVERVRAYRTNQLSIAGADAIRVGCARDGGLISRVRLKACEAYDNKGHGIKVRDNTRDVTVVDCIARRNGSGVGSHGMGTAHTRALVASAGAWTATSGGAYQASITTTALSKSTITEWLAVYCANQNGHYWLTPSTSSPPPLGSFYTGGSNTLEINVGAAPTAAGVYAAYLPVNATFVGCEATDTVDFDGAEGHGFGTDDLTESALYVGCRSLRNAGAGMTANLSQGAIVLGCEIMSNSDNGIYASGGKNVRVFNTNLIGNIGAGFRAISGATGARIRNCIVKGNTTYGLSANSTLWTIDENYNCIYANPSGARENVSGVGGNTITSDPLLDALFRLRTGSPCIDAGTFVAGAKHFGGSKLNVPADIGAYRYSPARSPTTRASI